MSGAVGAYEGGVGRTIQRIVTSVGDEAVRACGEIGRPRLVFVAPRRFVVRWPGSNLSSAQAWLRQRLALVTPRWLRAVQWVVIAALLVACGGRVEAELAPTEVVP